MTITKRCDIENGWKKREQKVIVAYKGDMTKIKELYPTLGRL